MSAPTTALKPEIYGLMLLVSLVTRAPSASTIQRYSL